MSTCRMAPPDSSGGSERWVSFIPSPQPAPNQTMASPGSPPAISRDRLGPRHAATTAQAEERQVGIAVRIEILRPMGDEEVPPHHELAHNGGVVLEFLDLLEPLAAPGVGFISVYREMVCRCDLDEPVSAQANEPVKKRRVAPVGRL